MATRLCFAFMLFLSFLLAIAMLGKNMQHWINESISQELWFAGTEGDLITDDLVGVLAVNRVMSASVALHLILLPLVIGVQNTGSARAAIQNSCWLAKILIWITLTVRSQMLLFC